MALRDPDRHLSSRMLGFVSAHRATSFLTLVLVGTFLASPTVADTWMDVPEGIEVDPTIVWGELPNGLRYALKHQPHPPGSTSLRMIVKAGFLHERADEMGLAHFVEHMGFNGTNRFHGETMGAKLEKEGIRFGADLTAFTWPSHTIYQLDLPVSDPGKLDLGITIFREWASEMRFRAKQVEREKGVILSEHNSRGHAQARLAAERLHYLYPESLLSTRTGLATPHQIRSVTAPRLIAFYQRWYRPDNTVIVAAGDFDPAEMAARIERLFGDWKRPEQPLPQIDIGSIANDARTRATLVPNEEVRAFFAELVMVRPRETRDSLETRRETLATSFALSSVQRRLNAIARAQPTVFGQLSIRSSSPTPFATELSLSGATSQTEWQHLSRTLLDEYRRLRRYGFIGGELELHRRHVQKSFDFAVKNRATRPASEIAGSLASQIIWNLIPTTPEFDRDLMLRFLPELDETACFEALRPFFREGFPALLLTSVKAGELTTAEVADFLNDVRLTEVEPPVVPDIPEFAYTDFGPPGTIAKRSHDAALDVHMIEFANGVKLNLKRTDFEADTVYLTSRIDSGGRLAQTGSTLGIANIAQGALLEGGLGKMGPADIQSALAGRFASLSFDVREKSLGFRGSSDTRDVELMLQLLTAYITDPEVRPEAVAMAKQAYHSSASESFRDIGMALNMRSSFDFFNEDPRFGFYTPETIKNMDPVAIRAWLLMAFNSAPIEIGLVGDFDVEEVIGFAAGTVGTLPRRSEIEFQTPARLRSNGIVRYHQVQSTEPKAALLIAWPAKGLEAVRRRRTLEILAWILRNELLDRIREKLGMTYSPSASYWTSEAVPGEGFLSLNLTVTVPDVNRAYEEVKAIAKQLSRRGLPRGSLERARTPLVQQAQHQLDANAYWLYYVVNEAQTNPESLVMPHTRKADLVSITEKEVEALAREVIDLDNTIVIIAAP